MLNAHLVLLAYGSPIFFCHAAAGALPESGCASSGLTDYYHIWANSIGKLFPGQELRIHMPHTAKGLTVSSKALLIRILFHLQQKKSDENPCRVIFSRAFVNGVEEKRCCLFFRRGTFAPPEAVIAIQFPDNRFC